MKIQCPSKRVTDSNGTVVSTVELDPWGGNTNRSSNDAFQPKKFTSYDRDSNQSDEAMHRRYNRWYSRFDQPDPYDGSYDLTDPQSFNRYAYVQNDPVNFTDPTGTMMSCNWLGSAQVGELGTYSVYQCRSIPPWDDWYNGPKDPNIPDPTDPGAEQEKSQTQITRNQQADFDDCARKAWRQYRKTYLKTSGKAVVGGVGLGIGLGVLRGAPGTGAGFRSLGFGLRGAAHAAGDMSLPMFGRLLTTLVEIKDSAFIGGAVSFLGGKMAFDSVRQADQNTNSLNSALEECKKKFPNANHSFTFLNF
jgi:RHS repeat-associated protein